MKYLNRIIFFISLFMVGCSSVKTPTGPTCVSCTPYYCRGSWHYPQKYYEYNEIGLASWYGDDCHGKPKATGEPFNKNAFTAAHKTLPLPSIVKVTNLRNGKSIIVLVDDRGPFVYQGRIIDLSYGASKALDLHRYKPSNVRVECLVDESLKLSQYIARFCKKKRDPLGRAWIQLYYQEIAKIQKPQYYTSPIEKRTVQTTKNLKRAKKQPASTAKSLGFQKKPSVLVKKQAKPRKSQKGKMDKFLNKQKI